MAKLYCNVFNNRKNQGEKEGENRCISGSAEQGMAQRAPLGQNNQELTHSLPTLHILKHHPKRYQ
jgi:hypothetical protein